MTEFICTRTKLQWLAFAAWTLVIGMIVYFDYQSGKISTAIFEGVSYSLIFCMAAYAGYHSN